MCNGTLRACIEALQAGNGTNDEFIGTFPDLTGILPNVANSPGKCSASFRACQGTLREFTVTFPDLPGILPNVADSPGKCPASFRACHGRLREVSGPLGDLQESVLRRSDSLPVRTATLRTRAARFAKFPGPFARCTGRIDGAEGLSWQTLAGNDRWPVTEVNLRFAQDGGSATAKLPAGESRSQARRHFRGCRVATLVQGRVRPVHHCRPHRAAGLSGREYPVAGGAGCECTSMSQV